MDQALITQDSSVIKQANKLIESVYRMDANEQKIILLAAKFVYDMEKKKKNLRQILKLLLRQQNTPMNMALLVRLLLKL